MKKYPGKPILISLAIIVLFFVYLLFFTGPNFSDTDRSFLKSVQEYQTASEQVAGDVAVARQQYDFHNLEIYANREIDLVTQYQGILAGFQISMKLYPYRDGVFRALGDQKASAESLLDAVNFHSQGQNSGIHSGVNASFDLAEVKKEDQETHLYQASRILQGLERPFWYYATGG